MGVRPIVTTSVDLAYGCWHWLRERMKVCVWWDVRQWMSQHPYLHKNAFVFLSVEWTAIFVCGVQIRRCLLPLMIGKAMASGKLHMQLNLDDMWLEWPRPIYLFVRSDSKCWQGDCPLDWAKPSGTWWHANTSCVIILVTLACDVIIKSVQKLGTSTDWTMCRAAFLLMAIPIKKCFFEGYFLSYHLYNTTALSQKGASLRFGRSA